MTNKPWPALLTIAAVVVALVISTSESASIWNFSSSWWVAWASQVLPQSVRTCLIWMIACFLTMRHGSTTWATRTVPIGVFVVLAASHAIVSFMAQLQGQPGLTGELGVQLIVLTAVGEVTTLLLASGCTVVFSHLLNVSLRRVNCVYEIEPLRFRIQTILVATTCVASLLAFQNWTTIFCKYIVQYSQVTATYHFVTILDFVCNALVLFGLIWLLVSTKRRWLGIAGILIWPVSPIANISFLRLLESWMNSPGGGVSIFLALDIATYVVVMLGILLSIPIFRLFGYQFRIGNQQEPVPTARLSNEQFTR